MLIIILIIINLILMTAIKKLSKIKKNGLLSISSAQLQHHLDCYHQQLLSRGGSIYLPYNNHLVVFELAKWRNYLKAKKKKKKNKNCSQYGTLKEMALDINDGVPSKTIEKIIFKNMMKIMLEKFNEQKKN